MLFINYKDQVVAMINRGDHLKVKQAFKKKPGHFFSCKFFLGPISYFSKRNRLLPPLVFAYLLFQFTKKS